MQLFFGNRGTSLNNSYCVVILISGGDDKHVLEALSQGSRLNSIVIESASSREGVSISIAKSKSAFCYHDHCSGASCICTQLLTEYLDFGGDNESFYQSYFLQIEMLKNASPFILILVQYSDIVIIYHIAHGENCNIERIDCSSFRYFGAHEHESNPVDIDLLATPWINGAATSELFPTLWNSMAQIDPSNSTIGIALHVSGAECEISQSRFTMDQPDDLLEAQDIKQAMPLETQRSMPFIFNSHKPKDLPKGYISAFNWFLMDESVKLRDDPKVPKSMINKTLGEKWKSLTAEEKITYEQKSNTDKLRYLKEMEAYNLKNGLSLVPRINPPKINKTSRKTQQRSPTVERPLTAYSHFCKQERSFVLSLECSNLQSSMGKFFSGRWSSMSPEERSLYDQIYIADLYAKTQPTTAPADDGGGV